MAEGLSFLGTATIPNAGTDSNVLTHNLLGSARRVIIRAPATLTGACTLHGSSLKNAVMAGLLPIRMNNDTADVTLVAGKETHIDAGNMKSLAIKSTLAEGAARAFQVYVVHEL